MLIPCGYYKEDILRALPAARLPRGWHSLPAVERGEVWAVDAAAYFSRPGPRVVEGAEILARVLHPDIFGAPDGARRRARQPRPDARRSTVESGALPDRTCSRSQCCPSPVFRRTEE